MTNGEIISDLLNDERYEIDQYGRRRAALAWWDGAVASRRGLLLNALDSVYLRSGWAVRHGP